MMSAGFQWGGVPNKDTLHEPSHNTPSTANPTDPHIPRYGSSSTTSSSSSTSTTTSTIMKKRKREDSSDGNPAGHNPVQASRKLIHPTTATATSASKYKRSRTPRIIGQPLPLPRLIESLDKANLQKLVQDLITIHPELQTTMTKIAPKPTIQDSLDLLHDKFNMIISHLPYKCDVESDYSYLRIKPHLQEFLSCVSDFILNYLPPLESNMIHSLHFLEEVTKMIIHNLPNFTNQEFQYTRSTALEQIANCWLIVLSQAENNPANEKEDVSTEVLVKVIQELEILEKLHKHNEVSLNKFQKVIDYCNDKLEQHELIMTNNNAAAAAGAGAANNGAVPASLSDLISVDYSKYSLANTSSI
ncbi:Tethering factor for nuclear proteasome STS1 [Candida viswanathii]|uniref:Tethering factor for nuclear proteasome STS1 n=1 Tax=Candida viswanathii TaxID=5486 RepID=A0A367YE42_9ASCO|nr:Tethering factor for nuclear proteasome STS1 [Candida viswanathii]